VLLPEEGVADGIIEGICYFLSTIAVPVVYSVLCAVILLGVKWDQQLKRINSENDERSEKL
jgi:hypothetical protein